MRDFVEFSVGVLILEEVGYHRSPEGSESATFITEGKVPGPKGITLEPLSADAIMSVAIFRDMLLDFGIDEAALDAAIARHAAEPQ